VAGELGVGSAIIEKVVGGNGSLEGGEQVLGSNTVA